MNIQSLSLPFLGLAALNGPAGAENAALRGAKSLPTSKLSVTDIHYRDFMQESAEQVFKYSALNAADAKPSPTKGACTVYSTQVLSLSDSNTGEQLAYHPERHCSNSVFRYEEDIRSIQSVKNDRVPSGEGVQVLQDLRCCTQPYERPVQARCFAGDCRLNMLGKLAVGVVMLGLAVAVAPKGLLGRSPKMTKEG